MSIVVRFPPSGTTTEPLLADAGIQVTGEPEVFEVYNTLRR